MPLADPSSLPLIERLQPGRRAFDQGDFFEAHELWEQVWRALDGEPRQLVQGLIQVAAGLHHRARGRSRPAARLVTKGLEKIARCAPALRAELELDPLAAMVARLVAQPPGDP
jgi:predicted metal-dependent hydrolase